MKKNQRHTGIDSHSFRRIGDHPILHVMKQCPAFIFVAVMTVACGSSPTIPTTPQTPTKNPTPSPGPLCPTIGGFTTECPAGPYTISGVVQEVMPQSARPVPGVDVNAWIDLGNGGYSYWAFHSRPQTDAMGRYSLQSVSEGARVWVQVETPGLVQECAVAAVPVHADQTVDVQLVSTANLSASRTFLPPPALGYRFVSGTVFKATETGTRPVAGASVHYVSPALEILGDDFWLAETFSDAEGHYLLCGLPDTESVLIIASDASGEVTVSVPPGVSTGVDPVIR
jgi:hypothetical protein